MEKTRLPEDLERQEVTHLHDQLTGFFRANYNQSFGNHAALETLGRIMRDGFFETEGKKISMLYPTTTEYREAALKRIQIFHSELPKNILKTLEQLLGIVFEPLSTAEITFERECVFIKSIVGESLEIAKIKQHLGNGKLTPQEVKNKTNELIAAFERKKNPVPHTESGITTDSPDEVQEATKEDLLRLLEGGEFPIRRISTQPIEGFEKLRRNIALSYSRKYGKKETDVFVEDASTLHGLLTEVIFNHDLQKTQMDGEPIPLEDLIPDDGPQHLVKISMRDESPKWRIPRKKTNGSWELLTYHGKIFAEDKEASPKIKMIDLNTPAAEQHLTALGVKNPKILKKQIRATLEDNSTDQTQIDLAESDQGIFIRFKGADQSYQWLEFRF